MWVFCNEGVVQRRRKLKPCDIYMHNFNLYVASPEEEIYVGRVQKLFVSGVMGALEILANHAPLLTELGSGPVWIIDHNGRECGFVVFGGILEVQPTMSIILANAGISAKDMESWLKEMNGNGASDIQGKANHDYAKTKCELAYAIAQLKMIKR